MYALLYNATISITVIKCHKGKTEHNYKLALGGKQHANASLIWFHCYNGFVS